MKSPLSLLAFAALSALLVVSQVGCAGVYAVSPGYGPTYVSTPSSVVVWGGAGFYGGTYYASRSAYYNSTYYRTSYNNYYRNSNYNYYRGGNYGYARGSNGAAYRTPYSNGGYYNGAHGSASWHNVSGSASTNRGGSASWNNGSGSASGWRGGSASWGGGSGSYTTSRGRSGSFSRR